MAHIGIVGCSAPGAALCYQTICTEGVALFAETHYRPEVSIHTHPFTEYMRCIHAGNWDGVAALMLSSAQKLADIGAEFCVAPCNTIHHAFESAVSRSPLPWLHIAEEVAIEAKRLGFRHIALLGTKFMMEDDIYPVTFAKVGLDYTTPELCERERIDHFIFNDMVHGSFTNEARICVMEVVTRLRNEGCDAVGMCCTELPLLFLRDDLPLPILDSTRILAMAAIRKATAQ